MRTRIEDVQARARAELVIELKAIVAHGPRYLDAYVEALLGGGQARPAGGRLHGRSTALIREIVLDAAQDRRAVPVPVPAERRSVLPVAQYGPKEAA